MRFATEESSPFDEEVIAEGDVELEEQQEPDPPLLADVSDPGSEPNTPKKEPVIGGGEEEEEDDDDIHNIKP